MRATTSRFESGRGVRLVQVGFVAVLVSTWFIVTEFKIVSPLLLPHPASVLDELWILLITGAYLPDLRVTMTEVCVAFAVSMLGGLASGYFISRSRYLVQVFEPLFSSLFAVPVVLFLPLLILIFGLGISSKIAMGIATSFFPIVLSTIAGFANVDRIYVTAARSMGCSNAQMFWQVLLPAALPVILTGLRMGFIVAFLSILGAEAIASMAGLGHRIVQHAELLENNTMFAYIALVITISLTLNIVLSYLERRGQWQ
jgi:ABC-type nitrate/sulfonate/bicarbonate transport system permease component